MRAAVGREWERIQGLDRDDALQELDDSLDPASPTYTMPAKRPAVKPEDAKAYARQVLGVDDMAGFGEIRKAFEKLNKRSDPSRFAEGSSEARQASDIQKRVHWAYGLLTEGMDDTEKRFRSLEID